MTTSKEIIIRNFELLKRIFDNLDVLSIFYGLTQRDINVIHVFCMHHKTYNAYIRVKTKAFKDSRKALYRSIEKLKEKNIIVVVSRPKNQFDDLVVYFTTDFIEQVAGEDFATIYAKWFEWQKDFLEEDEPSTTNEQKGESD